MTIYTTNTAKNSVENGVICRQIAEHLPENVEARKPYPEIVRHQGDTDLSPLQSSLHANAKLLFRLNKKVPTHIRFLYSKVWNVHSIVWNVRFIVWNIRSKVWNIDL